MLQVREFWQKNWVRHGVIPLLFYTVVTLVLTYPLVMVLTTHAAGGPWGDQFESVRFIWGTKEALLHGMLPADQPLLVYPDGYFSPVLFATPAGHVAGLPFALLFDQLVAYNLTFISASVLTGWAAYLLCWELTRQQSAALLGGVIVLAFPTRGGHLAYAHLRILTGYWQLLFLWSLVRFWRRPLWRWTVWGGVFLGLAMATHITAGVYRMLPLTLVIGGWLAWRNRQTWRDWLSKATILFVIGAIITLVFYAPFIVEVLTGEATQLQLPGQIHWSTDLTAFFTPSLYNAMFTRLGLLPPWAGLVFGDSLSETTAYLGLVAVGLAVIGLITRRREAAPWLALLLISMLFSLGPVLKVGGEVVELTIEGAATTNIVLPYKGLVTLPILDMARTPGRFNLTTSMGLAVLAAYGWAALSLWRPVVGRSTVQVGAVIVLTGLILLEYAIFEEFPTTAAPMPAYMEELALAAEQGEERPVLNLPSADFFVARWLLYYQTAHHQPVIAGHVVRDSPADPAKLQMLNAAALPPTDGDFVPGLTPDQQVALLHASGAEVVIVHHRLGAGAVMAEHLPTVLGEPVFVDDAVTIFEIPPAAEGIDLPVYDATTGWEAPAETNASMPASLRWMDETATLNGYIPGEEPGYWAFDATSWLVDRWVYLEARGGDRQAFFVPAGADLQRHRSAEYSPVQGFQEMVFSVPESPADCILLPGETACRSVALGNPRFIAESMSPINFGDTMRLLTFTWSAAADRLEFSAYWQALAPERADYTMFVHVMAADGELVAQWDAPLTAGGLPTAQWPADSHVWQEGVLALREGVPTGEYDIYIGLYTYPDLVRLPVDDDPVGLYLAGRFASPPAEQD